MPKLKEWLFGSSPKVKIEPTSTLSPEQQALLGPLADMFSGKLGGLQDGTNVAPQFGGDLSTQLDPSQTASLEGLTALANQISGADGPFETAQAGVAGAGDAFKNATGTPTAAGTFEGGDFSQFDGGFDPNQLGEYMKQIFAQDATDFESFFDSNIRDPLLEDFQDTVLPGISRSQGPSGFYSGDRIRQDDRARGDLLTQLTRSRADIGFQAEEARKGRQATAAQALDQLMASGQGNALDRALAAAGEEESTGRALAISDADRAASTALGSAQGQLETAVAGGALAQAKADTLGGIVSSGETARRADAENTLLEYSDFLRTAGFEDEQLGMLMQFLGLQTQENIVKNKPGSSGIIPSFGTSLAAGGFFNKTPAAPAAGGAG